MSRSVFSRLCVLVVEDNQPMRLVLRDILEGLGTGRIHECADGAAAIEDARRIRPDVILADLAIAPLDGLAFTRMLRADSDHPASSVPILMVTGFSDKSHVEAARDAGVTEFLGKPVTIDGVAARLLSVVENPRPFIRTNAFVGPDRRRRQTPIPPEIDRRQEPDPAEPEGAVEAVPR